MTDAARQRRAAPVRVSLGQAAYIIWYRDVIRFWRDRVRLVMSLAQPVLYLAIFGVGLSSSLGRGGSIGSLGLPASFGYLQFMYPGVLGMAVLFTAIFSAMSVVWDREFGFLREILVAPISRSAVAIGKTLGGATQATLQGVVMLVFAPIIGVHLTRALRARDAPPPVPARLRADQHGRGSVSAAADHAGLPGGDELPDDADVLPQRCTVPAERAAGMDDGAHPFRPGGLRHRPGAVGDPRRHRAAQSAVDRLSSITIGSYVVPVLADIGVLLAFSAIMLGIAMRSFRHRD